MCPRWAPRWDGSGRRNRDDRGPGQVPAAGHREDRLLRITGDADFRPHETHRIEGRIAPGSAGIPADGRNVSRSINSIPNWKESRRTRQEIIFWRSEFSRLFRPSGDRDHGADDVETHLGGPDRGPGQGMVPQHFPVRDSPLAPLDEPVERVLRDRDDRPVADRFSEEVVDHLHAERVVLPAPAIRVVRTDEVIAEVGATKIQDHIKIVRRGREP